MVMATFRRPLSSTCGLFETCRLVNCSTVAPHRGVLAGGLHLGNRNLIKPTTFLRSFYIEHATRGDGVEGALRCTCVAARWGEGSGRRKSTWRGGAGSELDRICLDARSMEESWSTKFSLTRGCGAPSDGTTECVQYSKDGRRFRIAFFSDSRTSSCAMYDLGGILSYSSTKLKKKNERLVKTFHTLRGTEVESTSRRSRNLEIYGQNYATNQRVLSEIVRILQENRNLEVLELGENCHVRLVVRNPGSDLFLGISVKAAKINDVCGRYRFSQCRKDNNILNLCASLPSLVDDSFRWWLVPGEQLTHLRSDTLDFYPEGKWGRFEVPQDKLADTILDELHRRVAYELPLSKWSIPKSLTHQKELEYFSQMTRKAWIPLACDVTKPLIAHSTIDAIIDGVCMQIKTSYKHKSSRGLRVNVCKQGGRDACGRCTRQPYTIDDGIDAIIVNVQERESVTGVFVFPAKEVIARGWFRGDHYPGKITVHVFPSFLSPRKGYESRQQWQLQYYLDVGDKVDLNRARLLLDQCKNGKRETE